MEVDVSERRAAVEADLAATEAASVAAAAAAEVTRIELQTDLNNGRQRIAAAEQARLELEVRTRPYCIQMLRHGIISICIHCSWSSHPLASICGTVLWELVDKIDD